eukprot:1600878-Pleurochrysis_carterae.AAC.5
MRELCCEFSEKGEPLAASEGLDSSPAVAPPRGRSPPRRDYRATATSRRGAARGRSNSGA